MQQIYTFVLITLATIVKLIYTVVLIVITVMTIYTVVYNNQLGLYTNTLLL